MKNHNSRVLKWFAALAVAGLAVSCANSEPINGFDQYGSSGTGGITATSTGGSSSTGGSPGTGGASTGGSPGTGGFSSTGGSPGTGGTVSGTGGQAAGGHAGSSAGGGHAGGGAPGNGGRGGGAAGGRPGGGGGAGGSSNATFAFVSMTIMSNCGGTTCHNGSQSVKFDSTSATTLYTNLTTMTAPDCKGLPLVTPGDATKSALYLAISKMCGGNLPQMPDGKPALPAATISSIQTWITNGAPQQ